MSYSVVQIFPGLEASIREYVPRCQFFFGSEEEARNLQPPRIIWEIDGGDVVDFERTGASSGMVTPKAFSADMVHFVAHVMGAGAPSTATNEKGIRQQEFAASEHLACVLRWAIKKSTAAGWLGISTWDNWTVIPPAGPEDRGYEFDCHFSVKVQVLAPEPDISTPPHTQTFSPINLELP